MQLFKKNQIKIENKFKFTTFFFFITFFERNTQ